VRQLIEKLAPLLCHQGVGLRNGMISFLCAVSNSRLKLFTLADHLSLIVPLVAPYLKLPLIEFTEAALLEAVKDPFGPKPPQQRLILDGVIRDVRFKPRFKRKHVVKEPVFHRNMALENLEGTPNISFPEFIDADDVENPTDQKSANLQSAKRTSALCDWVPKGTYVVSSNEHQGAITQICVSGDGVFFLSASEDGTVRVWDRHTIDRSIVNRSKLIYNQKGGKITALVMIAGTHTFASADVKGSIHVCKVHFKSDQNVPKYQEVTLVEKFTTEGYVISMQHYLQGSKSVLAYVTSHGMGKAINLVTREILWSVKLPMKEAATKILIDTQHNFAVIGTQSGYLFCYDIRTSILVKSIRVSKGPVYQLFQGVNSLLKLKKPSSSENSQISSSSSAPTSLTPSTTVPTPTSSQPTTAQLLFSPLTQLTQLAKPRSQSLPQATSTSNQAFSSFSFTFGTALNPGSPISPKGENSSSGKAAEKREREEEKEEKEDREPRESATIYVCGNNLTLWELYTGSCLAVFGLQTEAISKWRENFLNQKDKPGVIYRGFVSKRGFPYFIVSGADLKIRFWNLNKPIQSFFWGKGQSNVIGNYGMINHQEIRFYTEDFVPKIKEEAKGKTAKEPQQQSATRSKDGKGSKELKKEGKGGKTASTSTSTSSPPPKKKEPVMNPQQQNEYNDFFNQKLLVDCVVTMEITDSPFPCLITGCRNGQIIVWI